MAENIKIPVKPPVLPLVENVKPLSRSEQCAWNRLLKNHRAASNALDAAGFLLVNLYTTYDFAQKNGIALKPAFNATWESDWLEVQKSFEDVKAAIRKVEDHVYGIRLTKYKAGTDLDIIQPTEQSFQGFVIPILIGVVIVGAAIGASIWQYQKANALSKKYNDILKKTDDTLCSDKNSSLCKNWTQTKAKKNYVQNKTISDTLKSGISTVGKGLQIGLLVALPLAAWLLFGKKK